jgi:hypothetical protein
VCEEIFIRMNASEFRKKIVARTNVYELTTMSDKKKSSFVEKIEKFHTMNDGLFVYAPTDRRTQSKSRSKFCAHEMCA